jgi:hypothetical protein
VTCLLSLCHWGRERPRRYGLPLWMIGCRDVGGNADSSHSRWFRRRHAAFFLPSG